MAGGKYTTYRLMAQQAVNEWVKTLPLDQRAKFSEPRSEEQMNPWVSEDSYRRRQELVPEIQWLTQLDEKEIHRLLDRHGPEALEIAKVCGNEFSYWQMEAYHAIHHTSCLSLEDFYFRRTPLVLAYSDHGQSFLPEISAVFQDQFGWSQQELEQQLVSLGKALKQQSTWKLEKLS
jgi:glycerol-3-phosphate dehydrogenase